MDLQAMERAVRAFLDALGPTAPAAELADTPSRVARAWAQDLVGGYAKDPEAELTWTEVPEGASLVMVRGIRFASVCVHHLLPFFGVAQLAYLPGTRLAGLSKLGRVVDAHARRLHTQEELTESIVGTIDGVLQPLGVIALLRAQHTCMTLRGVRKETSEMVTLATAGIYRSDPAARRDVLGLLSGGAG